jgi:iron-sulfur cluster repair protein YtfE (RIC family)
MAHECACHRDGPVDPARNFAPATAEDTVGDVTRRQGTALEIFREMGINHCCGTHLTLREAAAAAGVPLDALLAALGGTPKVPA